MRPLTFAPQVAVLAAAVIAAPPARVAFAAAEEPVRVELSQGVPRLAVMRTSEVLVRVVNDGAAPLAGCSAADYEAGRPCLFLGAWFSDDPPRQLGTFQHTLRLEATVPPSGSIFAGLAVKPEHGGQRHLGVGIFRASKSGQDNGPVGRFVAPLVHVAPGSWLDEHRRLFLRALVAVHVAGTAAAAVLLALATRRQ